MQLKRKRNRKERSSMAKVTASKVIAKAKSFLGTKESPKNSNNVIFSLATLIIPP